PCRTLAVRELLVRGRVAELGTQPVARAQERPGELGSGELVLELQRPLRILEVRTRHPHVDPRRVAEHVDERACEGMRQHLVDLERDVHVVGEAGDARRVDGEPVDRRGVVGDEPERVGRDRDRHRQAPYAPPCCAAAAIASASAWACFAISASSSISASSNPAMARNLRARWIGFSSPSPRKPPRLKILSTVRWNSSARFRRSVSFSVRRRSQSEPIFTWVTSSASIQSSQNSSTGSPDTSPNSFIVLKTSIARPSSARFTPQRRRTGSSAHAASYRNVDSVNSPISVPIHSESFTE